MSVLIVVSHPDDEVLGCGGTAAALADSGLEVYSCILCADADARQYRPEAPELLSDLRQAHDILGIRPIALGNFPNIRLNTVPQLELVQFIEEAIVQTRATVLFTHHPNDLNDDHKHTSAACQAAARLFQRRSGIPSLKALYFMEILSSTDWAFSGTGPAFEADTFFEIGENGVEGKLEALAAYRAVMRPYPHPRSREAIAGLAAYRGGQAGMHYAEAFQTGFRRLDILS